MYNNLKPSTYRIYFLFSFCFLKTIRLSRLSLERVKFLFCFLVLQGPGLLLHAWIGNFIMLVFLMGNFQYSIACMDKLLKLPTIYMLFCSNSENNNDILAI